MQKSVSKELMINPDASLLDALKKMDQIKHKLLIVSNMKDDFLGLISIGDIQRSIIKNISMEEKVINVIRKDLFYAHEETTIESIRSLMLQHRLEYMPVINKSKKLIDIHFWEDLFGNKDFPKRKELNIPVVIMAGGIGSRLQPITHILPKPLIPLRKKSVIEEIIDRFQDAGTKEFYISVNYKADFIKEYLDSQKNESFKISYIREEKPLGTAGSLHLLKGVLNSPFFVSNCDIIIEEDFSNIYDYHIQNNNDITIVAALKHTKLSYGIIETSEEGLLSSMKEKPEFTFKINSGMYILNPNVLEAITPNKFLHITELISILQKKGHRIGVFPVSEKSWKDIGDWENYIKLISKQDD